MTLNGKAKFCLVILLSSSKIVFNWGAATYAANVDYDYVTIFTDGQSAVQAISRHLAQSCTVFSAVKELNRLSLDKQICHFRAGFSLRGKNRTTTFLTHLNNLLPCWCSFGLGWCKLVNTKFYGSQNVKMSWKIVCPISSPQDKSRPKMGFLVLWGPNWKSCFDLPHMKLKSVQYIKF